MSWAKRFPASSATGARAALTSRCNPCFAFRNDLNPSAAGGYRYTSFLFAPTQRDASGLRDGWSSRDGKRGTATDGPTSPEIPRHISSERVLHRAGLLTPPRRQQRGVLLTRAVTVIKGNTSHWGLEPLVLKLKARCPAGTHHKAKSTLPARTCFVSRFRRQLPPRCRLFVSCSCPVTAAPLPLPLPSPG